MATIEPEPLDAAILAPLNREIDHRVELLLGHIDNYTSGKDWATNEVVSEAFRNRGHDGLADAWDEWVEETDG